MIIHQIFALCRSFTHSTSIECLTVCQHWRERQFLKNEKSAYDKRESSDVSIFPDAVRDTMQKQYLSPFPLRNSCQNIDSDRAHIIIVDKFDSKAKNEPCLKGNLNV